MGFSTPIDGQTFTWDQYLEPVSNVVVVVGDLAGFSSEDREKLAGVITCVDAPNATLLVCVPVAPGVARNAAVQSRKILWLIRPKAKAGARKI